MTVFLVCTKLQMLFVLRGLSRVKISSNYSVIVRVENSPAPNCQFCYRFMTGFDTVTEVSHIRFCLQYILFTGYTCIAFIPYYHSVEGVCY